MLFTIYPINLVKALSLALELSSGGLSRHHWRTAMIAYRIGEQIDLDAANRQVLLYATLLHDLGAASNWKEKRKLTSLLVNEDIYTHAEAGYNLLKDSAQFGALAVPIRHHHDYWNGSSPSGIAGTEIPLISRIINLADRLEIMMLDNINIFEEKQRIMAAIQSLNGSYFDPELVSALEEISQQESFWLDLVNPHYYQNFFRHIDDVGRMSLNIDDVINIAEIFATVIDSTSRFTARHSRGVSIVAQFMAKNKGYSEAEIKMMRIAGLLHDLGKLAIPNEILEKPGKLTSAELAIIKQHPYYTYRILEQIDGFSTIAEWAAFHHETPDGAGYPFRIANRSLRLGSRIIAVADVFIALTEDRPYRPGMRQHEVENIMTTMAANNKLDADIVADLMIHKAEAFELVEHAKMHRVG
ncbi:3'3'-cGAMP-specific phosphodiesterase 1 [bioreactor metagenome]|uniref:3'3'-cGAMP-specific phosphodiesterase 1 n=1 Tax=bioreactor metagenome TaxID=1076179 RepID=A0A644SVD0_9ZZZZ|nr:HD domain-containing protein [Negativicutes bacterium]